MNLVVSSFSTFSARNIFPATIYVPSGSVAYRRPERLDRIVHDKSSLDAKDETVPAELQFAGNRSGAGRKTSRVFTRRVEVERQRIVREAEADEDDESEEEFEPVVKDDDHGDDDEGDAQQPAVPERVHTDPFDNIEYKDVLSDDQELDADCSAGTRQRKDVPLRKYNIHLADVPVEFALLICDEGHYLRDPRRRTSRACMLVNAESTVMMTATPTLNRVSDIFGLATQLWRRAKFFDYSLPPSVPWEYLIDEQFRMVDVKIPEVRDLRAMPPIEFIKHATTAEEIMHNNKLVTLSLLWYPDNKGYSNRAELLRWSLETGKRWWLLHPACVRLVGSDRVSTQELSGVVYREIQSLVMVRNRLNDAIELPDGTKAFPRDEMPAMKLTYVQCEYPKAWRERIGMITTELLRILPAASELDDSSGLGLVRDITGNEEVNKKLRDQDKHAHSRRVYMLVYRILLFLSIDLRQFEIAVRSDPGDAIEAALAMVPEDRLEQMYKLSGTGDHEHRMIRDIMMRMGAETRGVGPRMGASFTQDMTEQHPAGGLPLIWALSREVHLGLPPVERTGMVLWAINKSPALQAMLEIVFRAVKQDQRVLVVVNQPWVQT